MPTTSWIAARATMQFGICRTPAAGLSAATSRVAAARRLAACFPQTAPRGFCSTMATVAGPARFSRCQAQFSGPLVRGVSGRSYADANYPVDRMSFKQRRCNAIKSHIGTAEPAQGDSQSQTCSSVLLTPETIQERVLEVLRNHEKVPSEKITPTAHFTNDLGLDLLDNVEIVVGIEEEFGVVIPDEEADRILSVTNAVDYISKRTDAK